MKYIFPILLILMFVSCAEDPKENSFKISGTINGKYTDYIYLNYGTVKDSVKVLNNKFEFKGEVDRPIQGSLNLRPHANVAGLFIENNHISIKADYETKNQNEKTINFLTINDIKGSHSAKIQNEYKNFYQSNKHKENFKDLLFNKLNTYIETNKSHPFSGTILGELALIEPILTRDQLLALYSKVDTTQQNQDDLEMFKMGIENLNTYGINKPFLKFNLPDTENKDVDITAFLGNITLIDFWASWCTPCRKTHPELIKLKNKYDTVNFDIVSVSIDDNKNNWLQAIKKDKLKWTNLIDENKQVTNQLGIKAIPYNYLIDENGIILGANLSVDEIDNIIAEKTNR